jgi:branched-chain amino acid transport system substrate-binding protein
MAQAVAGLKAGYEAAMKANGGKWPTTEEVADAMHGNMEFKGYGRPVKMRADGQGLEDQLLGVTKKTAKYPFPVLDQMMIIPADVATTPVGQKSPEWVKSVKSDILQTKVKTYSAN